ncbi:helix-turn-helix domain-containing protein [Anaeropeptidivorans aminofermentans]|uniref:helix-turn-helix domain-containing protein n=1 Tax=Anaeropeptidivorans aminofermentans TaxID=2934315 RepID=UPI0020242132|nr:AraC family transcriptional regulator [Anaeropeptidivorans aminofermentans]
MFEKIAFLGSNVTFISKDKDCWVYKVKDDSGEGTMTCYSVFPGIILNYNDFHMEKCVSEFKPSVEMYSINHCREGRIEWELDPNHYIYLETGDLQLNTQKSHANNFSFPLKHYHGLTVGIFPHEASKSLKGVLEGYDVDIYELINRFSISEKPFIMRAGLSIAHIFSELYNVPEKIRPSYHKIKILELLLFLSTVDAPVTECERPYFHRNQVEKIKRIMAFLIEQPQKHYTLTELSSMYDISLTAMKQCFKAVYGTSIYNYMRTYRMNAAAVMLKTTDDSIGEISSAMGYDNPSKFSAAFKEIIGIAPRDYRKSIV